MANSGTCCAANMEHGKKFCVWRKIRQAFAENGRIKLTAFVPHGKAVAAAAGTGHQYQYREQHCLIQWNRLLPAVRLIKSYSDKRKKMEAVVKLRK